MGDIRGTNIREMEVPGEEDRERQEKYLKK